MLVPDDMVDISDSLSNTSSLEHRIPQASNSPLINRVIGLRCGQCHELLRAPYIECDECPSVLRILDSKIKTTPVFICLHCFSRGAQFDGHVNVHDFVLVRDNFDIIDKNWTSSEELIFLDAMRVCGVGSWETISMRLNRNKTASDCKKHFNKVYATKTNNSEGVTKNQMFTYRDGSEYPPRPAIHSDAFYQLAGYNAARSEFELEYDNKAENILENVEFPGKLGDEDDQLYESLAYAVAESYQTRLKERFRRQSIVRNHGLISESKNFVHLNRARAHLPTELATLFPKLHQLTSWRELCRLIESFKLETELRDHVRNMQLYRHNGLTSLCSARVFEELQEQHNIALKERRTRVVVGMNSEGPNSTSLTLVQDPLQRKASIPLDIVARAGYDKLDQVERKLASELRLLPVDFIKFKNIMIAECKKTNSLTLAHARLLIKIDVNKTRKIYDLLLNKNEISG